MLYSRLTGLIFKIIILLAEAMTSILWFASIANIIHGSDRMRINGKHVAPGQQCRSGISMMADQNYRAMTEVTISPFFLCHMVCDHGIC